MSNRQRLRSVAAAAVGLGGLLLARHPAAAPGAAQLGLLIFVLALFFLYRCVTHHFNRRDGGGPT